MKKLGLLLSFLLVVLVPATAFAIEAETPLTNCIGPFNYIAEIPCVFGGIVLEPPIPCIVAVAPDGTAIDETTTLVTLALFNAALPGFIPLPFMVIQPSQFLFHVLTNPGQYALGLAIPGGACATGAIHHLVWHNDLKVTGLPFPEKYFGSSPPGT